MIPPNLSRDCSRLWTICEVPRRLVQFIYPHLSRVAAGPRLEEIRRVSQENPEALSDLVGFHDPRAALPATGGTSASADTIAEVREYVMRELHPWAGRVVGSGSSEFDRTLGRAIYTALQVAPTEAASEGFWTFMTVTVFPDVAYQRFPSLPDERLLGLPRNVLRRVWLRHAVLGDTLFQGSTPLQEDELVGLFERSSLARNPRLLRGLAAQILAFDGRGRTAYARELIKEATLSTGPLFLDILDDEHLEAHMRVCGLKVQLRRGRADL